MSMPKSITEADILEGPAYAARRTEIRKDMTAYKQPRRLAVGPNVTLLFEDFNTLRQQVQEMLHIEKGGAEQLKDELLAYNPLVPNGREFVITMLIEVEDPVKRAQLLARLGGIEHCLTLELGGTEIRAVPEGDVERTNEEGKTSAVHFFHVPLDDVQAELLKVPGTRAVFALNHTNYMHMAGVPEPTRAAIVSVLD